MSHTNLIITNPPWEDGEYPEWIDVSHNGIRDEKRYVCPTRCRDCSKKVLLEDLIVCMKYKTHGYTVEPDGYCSDAE